MGITHMSLDLDYELRLALFDHIRRLAEAGGGHVTSAQLNQGISFKGNRVPIWNQQKGIFRPAILREYGAALTIQTAFDGPYDDHDDPNRHLTSPIPWGRLAATRNPRPFWSGPVSSTPPARETLSAKPTSP